MKRSLILFAATMLAYVASATIPASAKSSEHLRSAFSNTIAAPAPQSTDTTIAVTINTVSSVCRNDTSFLLQVNQTGGYFHGGTYVDSNGWFNPALTTQQFNKVYYSITNGVHSGIDSITVEVDTVPDARITPAGPFCQGSSLKVLTGLVNTGGSFKVRNYLSSVGVFYPAIALKGFHTVYYTYTDSKGCSNTDSTVIQVDSIPNAKLVPVGTLCKNSDTLTLQGLVMPNGKFRNLTFIDSTGLFDPSLAQVGGNKVYYTVIDGRGCINTDSSFIYVDSVPLVGINAAGPFCVNEDTA